MITVPEAARQADRNPETIRRWIREGKLPAERVGTQHLIDRGDLAAAVGRPLREPRHAPSADRIVQIIQAQREERTSQLAEAVFPLMTPGALDLRLEMPDDWLPAIVGRIVRLVDPKRIVLFGSRAHGNARSDSDYDLLVVLDQVSRPREMRIAIRRALSDLPIAKDVVVATEADLTARSVRPRGIIDWAADSGRTIYERR